MTPDRSTTTRSAAPLARADAAPERRTDAVGSGLQGAAVALGDDTGPGLDDAVARLSVALGRLTRALRRGSGSGLGPGSVSALATLVNSGPMRLGDLAAREGVAPPTLTRIVASLEDGGLVVRQPDPDDRRATRVIATAAANEMITGLASTRFAQLHARISALPESDRALLLSAVPVVETIAADDAPGA